jgi:hypothetical protein
MKRDKYNVIFMRDRTSIKSFRLSPFWIKFFISFFLLLFLVSIAGTYCSIVFFQEKMELSRLYGQKAEALHGAQKELERMENINNMIKSSKEDELRSFLRAQPGPIARQEPEQADEVPEIDLRDIFEPVDLDIVGISNVQARFTQNGMRVQLEVNNMGAEDTVSGQVFLLLVGNDGLVTDPQSIEGSLYYKISHFKQIDITFELPEGMEQDSLFALRIDARDDEGTLVYSDSFPLAGILI